MIIGFVQVGDIKLLICHLTLKNHVIERSFHFMSGSSSLNVTTLSILVIFRISIVEICHLICQDHVIYLVAEGQDFTCLLKPPLLLISKAPNIKGHEIPCSVWSHTPKTIVNETKKKTVAGPSKNTDEKKKEKNERKPSNKK